MIYDDITSLIDDAKTIGAKIVMTSGGFDPLHVGHLRCIQETCAIARSRGDDYKVVVVVNGDGFIKRKKGVPFMPHRERMEIIGGLAGVWGVVGWDDGSQTVVGAIESLRPVIFTKGGDRSSRDKVPESDICDSVGCTIIYGVGGSTKETSSSTLISGKMSVNVEGVITEKPWGSETLIVKCDKYALKILDISAGKKLSLQYHEVKDETIYVMSGILTAVIGSDQVKRIPGQSIRIEPGTVHRFCADSGDVRLIEVSTPELHDVVRLADDFGRK